MIASRSKNLVINAVSAVGVVSAGVLMSLSALAQTNTPSTSAPSGSQTTPAGSESQQTQPGTTGGESNQRVQEGAVENKPGRMDQMQNSGTDRRNMPVGTPDQRDPATNSNIERVEGSDSANPSSSTMQGPNGSMTQPGASTQQRPDDTLTQPSSTTQPDFTTQPSSTTEMAPSSTSGSADQGVRALW
jgi:hypothetical protein